MKGFGMGVRHLRYLLTFDTCKHVTHSKLKEKGKQDKEEKFSFIHRKHFFLLLNMKIQLTLCQFVGISHSFFLSV